MQIAALIASPNLLLQPENPKRSNWTDMQSQNRRFFYQFMAFLEPDPNQICVINNKLYILCDINIIEHIIY